MQTFYPHNTCICGYEYASISIMVRYVPKEKFSTQAKALPKLVVYGEYIIQRVVCNLETRYIALSFTLLYLFLANTFLCHAFHITLVRILD